jgi:hypothetical protein
MRIEAWGIFKVTIASSRIGNAVLVGSPIPSLRCVLCHVRSEVINDKIGFSDLTVPVAVWGRHSQESFLRD